MNRLSVVIPCLNDHAQVNPTIASLRDTTLGKDVEVIVIDDQSTRPVEIKDKSTRLLRMDQRVGGGVARHIGALRATNPYLLFTDAHMRFEQGWYEAAMDRIVGRDKVAHVGQCLGLSETNMDLSKAQGSYCGAKFNFVDRDPNNRDRMSVMEGVWDGPKQDDAEVECFMGACYFWPRQLFLDLGGKNLLREWGSEEIFTSLKLWLTGSCIRFIEGARIGHMFRSKNGYPAPQESVVYNKLMVAKVCMSDPAYQAIRQALVKSYGGDGRLVQIAERWLAQESRLVQTEQHRIRAYQTMDFEELLARFRKKRFW